MIFEPLLSWLAARVGRLGADAILIALIVAVAFSPFWLSYRAGASHCERTHDATSVQAQLKTLRDLAAINERDSQIAGDYVLRRGASEVVYRTLRQEVPHVVDHYVPAAGLPSEPIPHCVFTRGFVGLWNAALDPRPEQLPDAGRGASGAAAADGAADSGSPAGGRR